MPIHTTTPYIFTPDPDADNGPGLRSALLAGYRWIQINGAVCPIGTPVLLNRDDFWPYDGQIIEPAPGISKVTVDASGIGRNTVTPTDPSYAAIDYQGHVRPGSFLESAAYVNTTQVFVGDSSKFTNGDWIVISDASRDFGNMPLPLDGPMEVRQVIYVLPGSLIINRVIKRDHPQGAIVAKVTPLKNVHIRGLEFTGNCAVGVHLHYAQHCVVEDITTTNWTGRCLVLIDNGGEYNTALNCYCTGVEPGTGPDHNAWGIVMEGQDGSRMINCGGERCGNGSAMNYCIDSISVNARARLNNANVGVYTGSIRSGFLRPRIGSPLILDTYIGPDCVDGYIVGPRAFS